MTTDLYSTFVVDIAGTGDFTNLQPAINALPASGGKIFVKAGVYPITSTITITSSNVQIQGEGMGITSFVLDSAMTGNTPAIEAYNKVVGTPRNLVDSTLQGDTTITTSSADAASFTAGDYVLLYSDKVVDTEATGKHAGEVKQIPPPPFDPTSGIIPVDDQIFDTYTLADSAQVVSITMLQNITLSDFSITATASSSTLNVGFTHFRFVENLQIERVEVHDAFNAGIHLESVRNANISDCYIHHISDVTPASNVRYGVVVGSASQNVSVTGCRFSHTRHAVTTGGSSGKFANGVQRNVIVANCTSMLADTAHFDTHQPAENVTFAGCMAIGGIPATLPVGGVIPKPEVYGFQMRGRNCSVIGCAVLQARGKGIMLFGPVSSGASIVSNMIANVQAIKGTAGTGIYFDGPDASGDPATATSNHTITGNVIKNCDGSAIANDKQNSDIVISGNVIENTNSIVSGAAIQLVDAENILITGNNISGTAQNAAIKMVGTSDNWQITQNHLELNADISLSGTGSVVINNAGHNPVGNIPNPWPASGGDLTNNITAGSPNPQNGIVYTVRHSPKTIVVTGGDVSQIDINGINTDLTAGVFKLGIGET
ncbi:MAG: right-handed parallel beta-helix repeat-containing protein, partial [Verrucomicrobia bacterium]|nr:right-handed parallel beta-helix repeat-containing protein [Verrucomicrobiota bacterium]